MASASSNEKCFFCQYPDSMGTYTKNDCWSYSCPICGNYKLSDTAKQEITSLVQQNASLHYLTQFAGLAAEMKLRGETGLFLGTYSNSPQGIQDYRGFVNSFPSDFRQQYDRSLLNIARLVSYSPLQFVVASAIHPQYLFCCSKEHCRHLVEIFKNDGMIVQKKREGANHHTYEVFYLTPQGFDYVRKIEADQSKQQQAFVAMWFNKEMDAYVHAVEQAIRQAGYEPYIANRDNSNGLIMVKVMNKIKESRFVIADLTSLPETDAQTGVRGGVYFEAGYATGLKKEVILTCRDDVQDRIHFDLKQFFSIYWTEQDGKLKAWDFDFVDYLANHIIQSVGQGPLKVSTANTPKDSFK